MLVVKKKRDEEARLTKSKAILWMNRHCLDRRRASPQRRPSGSCSRISQTKDAFVALGSRRPLPYSILAFGSQESRLTHLLTSRHFKANSPEPTAEIAVYLSKNVCHLWKISINQRRNTWFIQTGLVRSEVDRSPGTRWGAFVRTKDFQKWQQTNEQGSLEAPCSLRGPNSALFYNFKRARCSSTKKIQGNGTTPSHPSLLFFSGTKDR